MKFTIVLVTLSASLAVAQPHHKRQHHQHAAHHEARAAAPVIEWVTEYEYTTEIVPVTKTIWVTPGFSETTPTSTPEHKNTVPAQFYELSQGSFKTTTSSALSTSTSPPPPPPPAPTTASVEPTTVASPVAQSTEEKAAEEPVKQSTEAPVQQAPETTVAPETTSAPPQTQAPAAVAEPVSTTQAPSTSSSGSGSGSSSGGSSTGECSSGNACTGDMTHYDAGLGACGWTTDGATENVVALSHLMMGTQSNGNPYCGKSITVKLNGKSITAKVVDKCMGCEIHAIDLSNVAFESLADMGVGRTKVEWYFN